MKTMEFLKNMDLLMRSLLGNDYLIAIIALGWFICVVSAAFTGGLTDSDFKIIRFLGYAITAIAAIVSVALAILLFWLYA